MTGTTDMPTPLVSTDWLADNIDSPFLRAVDCSWYLPDMNRDARLEYAEVHIPGAVFFDIDEIADLDSPYPHMMPTPEKFSSRVRNLGLGDASLIICYDGMGIFSAARVWWMFRTMGHRNVAVLDGGLPKWLAENRPVSLLPETASERHFTPDFNVEQVAAADHIATGLGASEIQILDARPAARFKGEAAEPRPGVRPGRIPGSKNLPFTNLFDDNGLFLKGDALRAAYEEAGIDLTKPVATTCGSGVTAAVLSLGLDLLGHDDHQLYDGAWSEWGSREDLPVETG